MAASNRWISYWHSPENLDGRMKNIIDGMLIYKMESDLQVNFLVLPTKIVRVIRDFEKIQSSNKDGRQT